MRNSAYGREYLLPGFLFLSVGLLSAAILIHYLVTGSVIAGGTLREPLYFGFFCFVFIVAGAAMLWAARRDEFTAKLKRFKSERDPSSPWLWDFAWNPSGIRTEIRAQIREGVITFIGMFVFCGFFTLIAFSDATPPEAWPMKVIVSFFDLVTLWVLGALIWRLLALIRYGVPKLHFQRFPYFLGDSFDATLAFPKPLPISIQELNVRLCYVAEQVHQFGDVPNATRLPICVEIYQEQKTVPAGERSVHFDIPAPSDAIGPTKLAERPPSYWELEVTAKAEGQDLTLRFLLPVYAR